MTEQPLASRAHTRRQQASVIVIGTLSGFGIIISGAVMALLLAGFMQWSGSLPSIIDDGLPLLLLAGSMLMAGRVVVDVAGRLQVWCVVGTAALVGALGMLFAQKTQAHGDAIEPLQVLLAMLVVLLLVGSSAWWVTHRRRRHHSRRLESD